MYDDTYGYYMMIEMIMKINDYVWWLYDGFKNNDYNIIIILLTKNYHKFYNKKHKVTVAYTLVLWL